MEVLVKLLLNIFDLTVFAYYFNTYKKTKRIPLLVMVLTVVLELDHFLYAGGVSFLLVALFMVIGKVTSKHYT